MVYERYFDIFDIFGYVSRVMSMLGNGSGVFSGSGSGLFNEEFGLLVW